LAFSYRDYVVECGWLRGMYERRRGRAPRSFFEVAAGPAGHAIEMLAAGLMVQALDLSSEMAAHGRHKAAQRGLLLPYTVADMARFTAGGPFDLVACLLCSASYLLTDEAVLAHFASVRASLMDDGMYVLELTHPSELTGSAKSKHEWKTRDDAGELYVAWRGDPAMAVNGIWSANVTLCYRPDDGGAGILVEDEARQRGFTLAEITSLARRSDLAVEVTLGGFNDSLALENPEATRMVVVLQPI
jgi:SAM-dependent methyltransferase